MKFELLTFGITVFFIANTYHDGFYVERLKSFKKYYQMIGIAFAGLSLYLYIKKNPTHSKDFLRHANGVVKYLPVDKDTADIITPFLEMTQGRDTMTQLNQDDRTRHSGKAGTKRSVSETKKKYVASQQNWKCGECHKLLPGWFEVDHKIRLEHGGSNHISNLVALCRDCHGKKTAMENL